MTTRFSEAKAFRSRHRCRGGIGVIAIYGTGEREGPPT